MKDLETLVEESYETLPEEVRALPDFPSIEVMDEPTDELKKEKSFPPGVEILGLFLGVPRTAKLHNSILFSPTVIHIYRGPINRCTTPTTLEPTVKRVVWHEVAHWLGHPEGDMERLGL